MELVRIYDRDFTEIGVMADYTFLEYTKEFREAGSATLRAPLASAAAELFVPDGYIAVPDGEMYIIRTVERDMKNGEVTVECAGLLSLLSGTVTGEEYTLEGDAAALLCALFRKSPGNMPASAELAASECGKTVRFSGGRSYLYDDMVSLCHLGGIGMSLKYTAGKLSFSPLAVRDRTKDSEEPVTVSRSLGGFAAEKLLRDFDGYKNVAIVSGAEKESGGRYTVTVRSDSVDMSDSFPDSDYFDRQMLVTFTSPVSAYMKVDAAGVKYFDEALYTSDMKLAGAAALGRCRPRLYLYGNTDDAGILPGDLVEVTDSAEKISGTAVAERVVTTYSHGKKTIKIGLVSENVPAE